MYLNKDNKITTDDFSKLTQIDKDDLNTLALVKRCPTNYEIPNIKSFKDRKDFLFFYGHRQQGAEVDASCLSNWYPSKFKEGTITFSNTEQYLMYHKAMLFGDVETQKLILANPNPGSCKSLGRLVNNYDDEIWEQHRYNFAVHGNFLKFSQNPELRNYLTNTGDIILVEASPYDKIWGIGLSKKSPLIYHTECWQGTNIQGFALMQAREIIKDNLV